MHLRPIALLVAVYASASLAWAATVRGPLEVTPAPGGWEVHSDDGTCLARRRAMPQAPAWIEQGEAAVWATWTELDPDGRERQWAIVSPGSPVVECRRDLLLRAWHGDPSAGGLPADLVAWPVTARATRLWIVHSAVPITEACAQALGRHDARILAHLPWQGVVVSLDPRRLEAVRAEPWVWGVHPFAPALRCDRALGEVALRGRGDDEHRVHIQIGQRGLADKALVAARLQAIGAQVAPITPNGFRLQARVSGAQIAELATWDEVLFVDAWTDPESDLDIVRQASGADTLEGIAGTTGQGVRIEVMDDNVRAAHDDFQVTPILFHGPRDGDRSHGTPVCGIVFGTGAANPAGRGILPSAQGIFADYTLMTDRYQHTAELLQPPYEAVMQTNSWGDARTLDYTTTSMEMDDIIFSHDILISQSQSNAGDQYSRPQAWAKNILSVGAVYHYDNLDPSNDAWAGGASIGPAADGRIKPDLCHFYDSVFAPASGSDTAYTQFGGTSAATPITAGHAGLAFQMWSEGAFGTNPPGGTVFADRPHAMTMKALLINTAWQYPFAGASHDLTRVHQGWGRADIQRLHDVRDRLFIIDESQLLRPFETHGHWVAVAPSEPALKVTLAYLDPPGFPGADVHRINDLSLTVRSPTGETYHGNVGLLTQPWSVPGGERNLVDTVENVFIAAPAPGVWRIEVAADGLAADSHLETSARDADYALVASAVDDPALGCFLERRPIPAAGVIDLDLEVLLPPSGAVDVLFEHTTDGGASWSPSTPAPTSAALNPALGTTRSSLAFSWDTAADGVALAASASVRVRATVSDPSAGSTACTTLDFLALPAPPGCALALNPGIARGDVEVEIRASSPSAPLVSATFEFSSNSGLTWTAATPATTSPLTNPATALGSAPQTFVWDSSADGLGATQPTSPLVLRARVDDGVCPLPGECRTSPLIIDNRPPLCTIAPITSTWGEIPVAVDLVSPRATSAIVSFEVSTDSGATFAPCTAAPSSPLGATAAPAALGAGLFIWSSALDLIGLVAPAVVELRLQVIDDQLSTPGICTSAPFTIDNTRRCGGLCGDCDGNTRIDILDALAAAQLAIGARTPSYAESVCCDANGSGTIEILDALLVGQAAVSLPVTLACP